MRDEIARLAKALEPSFTTPEDAELAASMMVMALRHEFSEPIKDEDRPRYQAALERLPKGSSATPRVVFVSPYDQWPDALRKLTALRLDGGGGDLRHGLPGATAGGDQSARVSPAGPRRSGTASAAGLPPLDRQQSHAAVRWAQMGE